MSRACSASAIARTIVVDPLGAGGVALDRAGAGALGEQHRGLVEQRGQRRVLGEHVRGEHLQRQRHRGGQPLLRGEHLQADPRRCRAAGRRRSPRPRCTPGRCASTCSIAAGSMTRPTSVSTVVRPASRSTSSSTAGGDRALGVADGQPHVGAAHRLAGVGQREAGDDRHPVVRQRVAEHRGGGDLDGHRVRTAVTAPGRGVGPGTTASSARTDRPCSPRCPVYLLRVGRRPRPRTPGAAVTGGRPRCRGITRRQPGRVRPAYPRWRGAAPDRSRSAGFAGLPSGERTELRAAHDLGAAGRRLARRCPSRSAGRR